MTRRPDTAETIHLALELLRRIPRNRKISATELHEQLCSAGLQRDLRTIQRQLEMLSTQFDIERDDRSKPYGYRWKERANGLSVPMLSEQESLLLTLAEQYLQKLLPASLMKSMDGFFAQARSNLASSEKSGQARDWLSKVRVIGTTQPLLPPSIKPGVFESVSNALYGDHWLRIDYKNANGKVNSAEVMPLGLAQQGPRLYLVCRYGGYDNERSLALHRLQKAEISSMRFERPKEFRLDRYDDDGRFGFGNGRRIRLTFEIENDAGLHLTESPLSSDQRVRRLHDGWLAIAATVTETEVLDWWLLGFGTRIRKIRRSAARVSSKDGL